MILDLSQDGRFVVVSAFKAPAGTDPSVALRDLRMEFPFLEVQFFEGERVAGKEHLEIAAINALRAFKTGTNISRSLAMEALLYASAQRQIEVAINKQGVTRESKTVGLVAYSETRDGAEGLSEDIAQYVGAELNDALLDEWSNEKTGAITKLFEIGPEELEAIRMPGEGIKEAIGKAVIERVALLSTRT